MNLPYEVIDIRNINDKIIVVYEWDDLSEFTSPRVWENVECFNSLGQKLWTVNGMSHYQYWNKDKESFVGTRMFEGRLQLTDFSGNSYDVDLDTGKVTHFEFHK